MLRQWQPTCIAGGHIEPDIHTCSRHLASLMKIAQQAGVQGQKRYASLPSSSLSLQQPEPSSSLSTMRVVFDTSSRGLQAWATQL